MRFLNNVPFDLFSLAMYPLDQNFLKASILRGPSAAAGRLRGFQAQGCVDKAVIFRAHSFLPGTSHERAPLKL